MNALILEDEVISAKHLVRMLSGLSSPAINVLKIIPSVKEAVEFLRQHKGSVDVVFSDIRLEDGLSFDALAELAPDVPVIFTTAYDEYAVKAFDYNGVSYLLKPVREDALKKAVARLEGKCASISIAALAETLQRQRLAQNSYRRKIKVDEDAETISFIDVGEIVYIHIEASVVMAVLADGRHRMLDGTMNGIENELDPEMFFRISRQCIVNLSYVKSVKKAVFSRSAEVIVASPSKVSLPVSRDRLPLLMESLGK